MWSSAFQAETWVDSVRRVLTDRVMSPAPRCDVDRGSSATLSVSGQTADGMKIKAQVDAVKSDEPRPRADASPA